MSQEAITEPWPAPPICTRPGTRWCGARCIRSGEKVCHATKPCAKEAPRAPAPWSETDMRMLSLNSHLDVEVLRFLLPGRGRDEIRAKLQEVDP